MTGQMEEAEQGWRRGNGVEWVAILNGMVREGGISEVTRESRSWRERVPSRRNSKCKRPEAGE